MFEQTFVATNGKDRKPYTVLFSLFMQVCVIAALIIAPLVYTQILPKAQLRSVFAAPTPPPPALPKPPTPTSSNSRVGPVRSTPTILVANPVAAARPELPPALEAPPVGVDYSTTSADMISLAPATAPDPPKAAPPKPAKVPIRITTMQESQLIHKVQPVYPPLARVTHIQGSVEFTAVISKEGAIERLQLVHGHPMLVNAAREAILQWRYHPTLLNGEAVEVVTQIIVNFTLTQ